jgi:hypothetical protein
MTNWHAWRKCPICSAEIGEPCTSLSGLIVGGQPDKVSVELILPHRARKARAGYVRAEPEDLECLQPEAGR